eukprot:CAMPEP_0172439058 /NCGR_PEP_ID=MMETSP1065-20121228/169_1 /TAXON_ID=265537 /ORGANISM="Amphiprora paludosa, Strain CCMP125" /LENGTH=538 /DNA_ID=CAMNT_0013187685 /DNA_START=93 /DNA_END=1709 /DNA_ORIENTATION=-
MSGSPPHKKRHRESIRESVEESVKNVGRDVVIAQLQLELDHLKDEQETYYSSSECAIDGFKGIPDHGFPAGHVKERIIQNHELDNRPRLNTSSYVNVVSEPEEREVALMGLEVNLADASVYPASVELHDKVVNMIAELWNCPPPAQGGNFSGSGTVGSTEACLLAGLAHKFRWRQWYQTKHGLTHEQVMGVVPNIVISTCYQAAWEKLFRYFDVIPKFVVPTLANKMAIDANMIRDFVDDKTMAVVGILGNHYNGAYDPIWDMDKVVSEINAEKGYQVGIHVDGASGGFIAPFQDNVPAFDFRLTNVLSMSASGHKFGESCCGTGWLVFRHREQLAEHISVSVTYLGGVSDSMTLNFSRPATGPYVQAYKFLRLGKSGYRRKVQRQLDVTKTFRNQMREMTVHGKPLFQICDADENPCLPVFAARINPELNVSYDDFSIQHAIGEFHWYVGAYYLSFEDFSKGGKLGPLCSDESVKSSMFRVVFKSNLTHSLAHDLINRMKEVMAHLHKEQVLRTVRATLMEVYGEVRKAHSNDHKAC